MSIRRIRAIVRKELLEYRRTPSIVVAMAIIPLIFLIQPLVVVFGLPASSSGQLAHGHVLLYLLGIPALVPVLIAAYAVAGERQQGTLEPVLTTPVRREEFLLGKALAALVPSAMVAYAVYALFIACVEFFADTAVASALLQWPQILAQVLLTPLIAAWSIWAGMGISARSNDIRVAQQLGMLAGIPTVALTSLIAFDVIHLTLGRAFGLAAALLVLDAIGWRIVSSAFDRERLITGTR
ncbi:ABC transporter permease [Planotetraspora thailandica]|uniref:ABC transporter permease n=1 Tax=Planotetraspora thailandica TaxID=487172 RepID=UPI0019519A0D|nr:ABC transporter permease subunit [Planotetraspora thailandica]